MSYRLICRNCGELTNDSCEKDGCLVGLAWIFFIFISFGVGLIFFVIYKLSNKANCCPHCKADNALVPVDTPIGEELTKKYHKPIEENTNTNNYFKEDEKINPLIIVSALILLMLILTLASSKMQTNSEKNYKGMILKEIYKYPEFGMYAYYIPKKDFNLKKAVNYAQTLEHSKTNFKEVFYYDKMPDIDKFEGSNKTIPLYLLNEAWKERPFFYFSALKNNREWFCKINGWDREVYVRNIVKGNKLFNPLMEYGEDYFDASNGCLGALPDI